ncbi:phospholipase D family protein [Halostella salina]|uniref:phospholipase D family protein n=1 Tax=Halostella salina TaxID=1547897 RepID=UPI000EF768CA|nr:phospholipase D family protein [Halostella salina]
MTNDVFLSGTGTTTLEKLNAILEGSETLFFASAYVTRKGVDEISNSLEEYEVDTCGAVFGLDGYVTEPKAIETAQELGWEVRLATRSGYTFHPKIALTGGDPPDPFSDGANAGYIGSANFTGGGLDGNIEAGMTTQEKDVLSGLEDIADEICRFADPVGEVDLESYASRYAEVARERPSKSETPGVGELSATETGTEPDDFEETEPPNEATYESMHATAAWAGLQSFTGEYTFQLEFPRTAGLVIQRLTEDAGEDVNVLCSDGEIRAMTYAFYPDNEMFRLNIPNEVPGIETAREDKSGIGLVRTNDSPDTPIQLEIINDEAEATEIIRRSVREGAWDQTSTRLYGWF